jgi:tetratricopeptide (TPR) repeat protein
MDQPTSELPTPDEVRSQVERMIASDDFRRSPQLGAFLRFVVEAVLHGKSDRIKAYTIGVEVLRRDVKFDPQLDPIVRVEATRLRRTIDRYYARLGADDPIRITLPRGTYVPTFRRRSGRSRGASRLPAVQAPDRWQSARALLAVAIAVVVFAVVAAVLYRSPPTQQLVESAPASPSPQKSAADPLPPGNGMPDLFMPHFDVAGTAGPRSIMARSLHDALSDAFTHFDLVNVLLEPSDGRPAPDRRADYRFEGSVEYSEDGAARLLFRLIDTGAGSIVWSRLFDRVPAAEDQAPAGESLVRQLAGALLQPFGVIYARQRGKVLAGTVSDPRYRCLVDVIDSFSSFEQDQQARGRDCLERLTARESGFALGFTYLAALDLREYQYGLGARPGDTPPLERGLAAARRGVELSPESSRAYEMLFLILFARRDAGAARDAGNKPIMLNRYDMRSLGSYGARLIASGEINEGTRLLRQAGDDGTVRPPFEEFCLFLGDYLRNDEAQAAFHAAQLTNDQFQLGLMARALVASAKGDHDAARAALARLVALNPSWRDNPRGTLEKFFYAPAIIDRLAGDLAMAGLPRQP